MNDEQDKRVGDIERQVEQHDLWLRGDGQLVGVMPSVRNLLESCSRMETSIKDGRAEVQTIRDAMLTGKGWIAGAMVMGGAGGGLVVWIIEKFVLKHP